MQDAWLRYFNVTVEQGEYLTGFELMSLEVPRVLRGESRGGERLREREGERVKERGK